MQLNATQVGISDAQVKLEGAKLDPYSSPLDTVTSQFTITQSYLVPNYIGHFVQKSLLLDTEFKIGLQKSP